MGGRRKHRRRPMPQAAVDMTSLIDLTFLLLVTFIVTLPALEQGISVLLPRAKTDALPSKDSKANTVTVDADNRIYLNDKPVSMEELEKELTSLSSKDPDVPVLVRGDERLDYGKVMSVVKTVYKSNVRKMALVTVEK